MNAPTYGVEKITQAREGEYRVQFSRPQLADVVREQKRLRIRQLPLLARWWAARPRVHVGGRQHARLG